MGTAVKSSRVVLTRTLTQDNVVDFVASFDDTKQIYRTVKLAVQDWEDLGSPEEITVSIEPGNTLGWGIQTPKDE